MVREPAASLPSRRTEPEAGKPSDSRPVAQRARRAQNARLQEPANQQTLSAEGVASLRANVVETKSVGAFNRAAYQKAYMKTYMPKWRARQKAAKT
jgi:hypothetical protein